MRRTMDIRAKNMAKDTVGTSIRKNTQTDNSPLNRSVRMPSISLISKITALKIYNAINGII
jgi:hypothetical protein